MAQYRVMVADKRVGPEGWVIELAPAIAAWINRDRGCTVLEEVTERAVEAPPADRMMRRRKTREVKHDD